METIDENFYKAEGLLDLIKETHKCVDSLKPKRLWLRRLAFLDNLNNYYRFAVSSVRLFQESLLSNQNLISKGERTKEDFDDKSHSSALSFYSHSRVCIESSRLLSEEAIFSSKNEKGVKLFQKHRDSYNSWAQDIIEKRNKVIAHPHAVRKIIVGSPSSWGNSGEITFNTINLEHVTIKYDEYRLNPVEDLKKLKWYIEETVTYLELTWDFSVDRDESESS